MHWDTPEDYSGVDSGSLEVPTLIIHVGMLWPLDSIAVAHRVWCFSALFHSAGVVSMSVTVNVKWRAAGVKRMCLSIA